MDKLKIKTKIKPADQFLHDYQVKHCKLQSATEKMTVNFNLDRPRLIAYFQSGKADDFEVLCRDGKFGVHLYCLINSDFLYKQYKARKNFEGEGKGI